MTKKFILGIIAVIILAVGAVLILFQPSTMETDETKEKGFLEGTVTFMGTPCPPGEISGRPQVPPCDGPYPNHEVIVYKSDGKTVVTKVVSNEKGVYKVSLNSGSYVIYTQNGPFANNVKTNKVTIESGKTTKLNLVIDTGIR